MSWQIVGHKWAVDLLQQSLAADREAHAYLFSGPRQIGKTKLAILLAQALNCLQDESSPCGQCRSCKKIDRGTHPDIHVVEGEGASGSIKIEQIRSLQREAVLRPYEGRCRVFILRHVDRATAEAADSLLKTLEEPPAHVTLVLTAEYTEILPATVVSRCQRLDLRPIPIKTIEATLRDRGVAESMARLLARLAAGRVGWALNAQNDDNLLQQRQQDLDQMVALLSGNRVERLDFAWKASRDPAYARRTIELWTGWWRDLLLITGHGQEHIVNVDRVEELGFLAAQSDPSQAWHALKVLQTTAAQLQANVNARLALESLLLRLPHWPSASADRVW